MLGRIFAMWTSKQPHWPKDVEDANLIDADDPYVLTWRDNLSLGWWELWWPTICTVIGAAVVFGIFAAMFLGYFG